MATDLVRAAQEKIRTGSAAGVTSNPSADDWGELYRKKEAANRAGSPDAKMISAEEHLAWKKMQDEKKIKSKQLEAEGYSLKASPYEFDESAYQNKNLAQQLADINAAKGTTAGQVAGMAGPQGQYRDTQSALINQLSQQASGQGPSVVQAQYRSALDKTLAANKAQAMSANVSPAMAARMAAQGTETAALTGANAAAQLKAQEQQAATTQLAQVANQARTLDLSLASNQQQYLNDMTKYYMSLGMDQQNAQMNANIKLEEDKAQSHAQAQTTLANQPKSPGLLGSILGGVSSLGAAAVSSDEDLKEDVEEVDDNEIMDELPKPKVAEEEPPLKDTVETNTSPKLNSLSSYKYTNETEPEGTASAIGRFFGDSVRTAAKLIGKAGSLAALSDKDIKQDISDANISEFMKKLVAKKYNMKEKAGGAKNVVGVMAQDAAKSKLGKTIIEPLPEGYKGLDVHRSLSLALAGISNLHKRLAAVEDK